MNAKTVLKKLVSLLQSEEVKFTYAKLADGTIVESPTFDVGEPLEVVSEDGTKNPAPDGEHELTLKDESGNENIIKVITKDGIIAERENVELEEETKTAEELPEEGTKEVPTEMAEEATIETKPGDIPQTGDGIPAETEDEEGETEIEISLGEMVDKLSYRISELEKKIQSMEETPTEEVVDKEANIEEELPKLDGAPVEASAKVKKFSIVNENKTARNLSPQEKVLAKLYNKNN